jgi:hypothetical protein
LPRPDVHELRWRDPPLAEIGTPKGKLRLTLSVGSGLARRPGDPPGRVWGLGDRGPNLKVELGRERYGLRHLKRLADLPGAKLLPLPDFQPMLAELQVGDDRVELVRTLPLGAAAEPCTGRPPPGDVGAMEPVFDLAGQPLAPDPAGCDPEGVAALAGGGFWVAEEYGPSLMRIGADGAVMARWAPPGTGLARAEPRLPAEAGRRRLNRGFEGVTLSADERVIYTGFQSGLTGDPRMATLIWKLDARDGALISAHAYPFDAPETFSADAAAGEAHADALKVCELVCVGPDRLLVLERIRLSARIYRVDLAEPGPLAKTLLFSTNHHPWMAPDLEGVTTLSDRELLLATDNDFGTEGAETRFYRVTFAEPF